jgi:cation diffusion facilitator family transporter
MSQDKLDTERRGLLLSVGGALGMSALGFGFSAATGSAAVLLDGIFSLIGFAVGLVAMRVATLVRRPDDESFHFGYAAYEPMLNLCKGLLIAFVSLIAAIAALDTILRGGREIAGPLAVVYAVLAALGCLAVSLVLRRLARRTVSPLLEVDARNWLIDAALSGAVAVAFVIVVLLEDGPLARYVPFADPAVVILLALLTAPIPIQIIRSNWDQLLGRAPRRDLQDEAHRRVRRGLAGTSGLEPRLRILEMGRTFYVQVYLVLDPAHATTPVEELDRIRERVWESVTEGEPDIGVDVVFTLHPRWVRRSTGASDLAARAAPR